MIPGLKEREPIKIPIYGGGVINVIIPDAYYSMEEADEVCKKLRKDGYHCGIIYRYVHRSIKLGVKTAKGIRFIRANE